ncbi:hypothetical protein LV469_06465 [Peptoniphilus sp. GNH]|nr:hypothetical protein HMPREF3189_00597 [Clostridiales bacterium KA00134]UHR02285.1 hypothetical protein LV469_06465 [Peptoniphilus sp. GNH]
MKNKILEFSLIIRENEDDYKIYYYNKEKNPDILRYGYKEDLEDQIFFEKEGDFFENHMGEDAKYFFEEIEKASPRTWTGNYKNDFRGPYPIWELGLVVEGEEALSISGSGDYPKALMDLVLVLKSFE